ncbi:hypothetical protein GpartN1_g3538.t1 [Galdieria partita]|uniref:SET domain-containing protein n=1 Tax=Galdieria partita TaxID=83374 RepID=A0A9C7PXK7_9RHOD|nr:hypothetical protein GpartN1_g3538.t1 [Galdieria partita]
MDDDAKWSRFERWLETHQVTQWKQLLSLEHYDDGYRTFHAKKPISKGSILLEIPDLLLITGNKVSKWLERKNWISHKPISGVPGILLVSIFLFLESREEDSFWKPYLEVLPTSYDLLFLFQDSLLRSFVMEADIIPKVESTRRILRDTFQRYVIPHCYVDDRDKWVVLFKEFVRCYCAVVSRICFLPGDIAGALVPLGDMFNHEALDVPMDTVYAKWERGYYVFRAHRNFSIGTQVFVSYGACSNTELLLYYGFTLNENPWDTLTFYPHELDIKLNEKVILDRQGFSVNLLTAISNDCDEADVDNLVNETNCARLYDICSLLETRESNILVELEKVERNQRRVRLLKSWIRGRLELLRIVKDMYRNINQVGHIQQVNFSK